MSVQWVHLPGGGTLVASTRGAWIQQPTLASLGLLGPMTDSLPATPETTGHLLDGAIAAAEREAPDLGAPTMTATRWAWHLVAQWYCAHHSVALLPEVTQRYEAAGRRDLAEFAVRKLEEEQGHDRFPVTDLRALGYDAEAAVRHVPTVPSVKAGVDYARACARGEHPAEFLGYVYALERRVIRITDDWLIALDAVLPPGVDAASGIRLHVGEFDVDHVAEAVIFVAGLPADDRTLIAQSCHRTTEILCDTYPGQHPSDAELERLLSPFRREQGKSRTPAALERQGDRT
jgi:hypothetical protein